MSKARLYFVADFIVETLVRLIANTAMPDAETRTAPPGHVVAGLAAGTPGPDWTGVVWTRPESVVHQFQRALAFDDPDPATALAETRAFADAVAQFASGTRATLVPSWVVPPWFRGYGPLDLRPQVGIAALLARMNLALVDALQRHSNVFVLDTGRWVSSIGSRAWSDKQWYASKSPFTAALLELAAGEIAAAIEGLDGSSRRLIILDLDDVLWGGIVGEVGWEGLNLGGHDHVGEAFLEFQRALKGFSRRGIQLSIVSKNDERVALEAIDRHPEMILRREDFAGWRINWDDKAQNVESLLAEIGFGAESAVFIDDSAIERTRVAEAIPGIFVPDWPADPSLFRQTIASLRCFDAATVTAEDRSRTAMYAAERTRRTSVAAADNLEQWMASLDVTVTVEPLTHANLDRAAQLFNKTNQMNLSTRRLSASELLQWSAENGRALLTFRVADRFGDSGLTGIVGLQRESANVRMTDFLLSCRVMGRNVERAMLTVAAVHATAMGGDELLAELRPTARNSPCLEFFRSSGLRPTGEHRFVWKLDQPYGQPPHVTVRNVTAPIR